MSGQARSGKITFDCVHTEHEEANCFDGCYRVPPGEWKVFWFNNNEPLGRERCAVDVVFPSGVLGTVVEYNDGSTLNKFIVKRILMELVNVSTWQEVQGPNSLELK